MGDKEDPAPKFRLLTHSSTIKSTEHKKQAAYVALFLKLKAVHWMSQSVQSGTNSDAS